MTRVTPPTRPPELSSTKTVPMDSDLRVTADFSSSRPPLTARAPSNDPNDTKILSNMFLEPATIDMSTGMSAGLAGAALPEVEGYALIRRIGHGGMGVVFEGVQHATGRRVAMKFMLDGAMNADAARKRFEREVEVVAGLQHPGIVSVIDSGVRKGRYFYVMEYVEGRPLDEAMTPGTCGVRQAMELLAQICDAVDYAHQRGVLHRDLKPSNVIIDGAGQPHLLDFGLAKRFNETGAASSTLHGRFGVTIAEPGQLVGTVAYMSPEQSLGKNSEMGVRSDIYALGVIAYELITGKLPVEMDGSIREVLARIAEKDPARPSLLRPGVGRDLDAVLLKALDKSPARRYATVGEFAEDLRRFLAGMPVTARTVGPAGRFWRWVRRNEALASVIAASIVIIASVSTLAILRIIDERNLARRDALDATEALKVLVTPLGAADPNRSQKALGVIDLMDSIRNFLDESPPSNELTVATTRELIGVVYRNFDEYPKALENLTKALEIRERHPESKAELAKCLHNLAALHWLNGRHDTAKPLYERERSLLEQISRRDSSELSTCYTHLAACYLRENDLPAARELYTKALQMRQRMYPEGHEEVAQALNNLAKTQMEAEEYGPAEDLFRQALSMIVHLKGETYAGAAAASQNLATLLMLRGNAKDARKYFEQAVTIRRQLYPAGHFNIGASLSGAASAELAMGDAAEALKTALEARKIFEDRNRVRHTEYAECLQTIADATMKLEGPEKAEPILREALRVADSVEPAAKLQMGQIRGDLGALLAARGELKEAHEMLRASVDLIRADRKDRSGLTIAAAKRYIEFCDRVGKRADADPYRALVASLSPPASR